MSFTWVFLSVLSGFGQALGWALSKKTLANKGINHTLGCVVFFVAGVLLSLIYVALNRGTFPPLSERFVVATVVVVVANVIGAVMAYKALQRAAMSLLMPFFAVISLGTVPVEYFVRGVVLHSIQVVGILVLVVGAILLSTKAWPDKSSRSALGLFSVSILCYSIGVPYCGVAVEACGSALFAAAVLLLGIGAGFVPLVLFSQERQAVRRLREEGEWKKVFMFMAAAGAVTAFFETGPSFIALQSASASEVFALKRVMPFFALVLGVFLFNEKVTRRHVAGTAFLVAGSMMVVWFR